MRGSRVIFWITVLVWIIVPVTWIGRDPNLATSAFDLFSTYNTSPGGTSLAYSYLQSRFGESRVKRLVDPSGPYAENATVIRIGPDSSGVKWWEEKPKPEAKSKKPDKSIQRDVSPLLETWEEEFVRRGGRLIIAFDDTYRQVSADTVDCAGLRQVFPMSPDLPEVALPHCRVLRGPGLQQFHSLLLNGSEPVLVRSNHGRGEVMLLSLPEIFSNEHIGKVGHVALLERLAAGPGPIYFDETVHRAFGGTSLAGMLIEDWRLGPSIAFFFSAALLLFWRRARRLGAPDRIEREERSDAIDLVDSVGQLYDRSIDREAALRLYYHSLTRLVHERTGLSGEALERSMRERTAGYDRKSRPDDMSKDEFQRMLRILNHAYETVGHGRTF